jgi:hypothetical protein
MAKRERGIRRRALLQGAVAGMAAPLQSQNSRPDANPARAMRQGNYLYIWNMKPTAGLPETRSFSPTLTTARPKPG